MKKIIYMLIANFIIILFCYPLKSQASENATIYMQTNTENIIVGDEIEVSINLKGQKTSAYSMDIFFDKTKLEYISGPENSNAIGNKVKIVWFDPQGGTESKQGELGKLKFKAIDTGIADFDVNGEFFNNNADLIQTDFDNLQMSILEKETESSERSIQKLDNAQLQSLRLNVEGMVPDFETDIYNYDLTIPEEMKDIKDIEVEAVAKDINANIEISGNKNLKEGLNLIKIIVRNQGKKQEYKIRISKTEDVEIANVNLENLAIEYAILSPEFSNQITRYNTQVSNETVKLNILAIPENEQGKVEIFGNDNLSEGNNKIEVKITAPNEFTQRTYEINVYKRNKQEEEVYNQEAAKVQQRLEDAYSINKTLSREDSENNNSKQIKQEEENKETTKEKTNRDYLLISVDVFVIIAIIIGFLTYKTGKKNGAV